MVMSLPAETQQQAKVTRPRKQGSVDKPPMSARCA